ncbi:MAG: hypothetical protein JWN83_1034, partial [Chitinophagaceae bacterium]|nr:hypothetical protein [Chitinophagaceae bacterium]
NFNSPVYLCDLAGCNPTYKWKVDGVLQGTGTSFSYTAVAGSHLITIQPYCGIDSCSPCEFKVVVKDEKSSCNCSFKPVFEYIARSGKTGNYYSQL